LSRGLTDFVEQSLCRLIFGTFEVAVS